MVTQAAEATPTPTVSWWKQLPLRMKLYGQKLFSPRILPNDNKVQYVVKEIFKTIGYLFLILATLPPLPLFLLGYLVVWLCEPSKLYAIGNGKVALSPDEILRHLKAIEDHKREITELTIVQNSSTSSPLLSADVCAAIKRILPQKIFFGHNTVDLLILNALSSDRHYYVIETKERSHKGLQQITLREKIPQVILPNTIDAAIAKMKKLADRKVRITTLYFTCLIPTHLNATIQDLILRLGPPALQCRIYDSRSPAELKRLLNTCSSDKT